MTVAAIVLTPDAATARADADGLPALRRVVQAAWAGGALPIIVVAAAGVDTDALATAVEGLPAQLVSAAGPPGAAWFGTGLAAALQQVRETDAALLWPVRHAWIDPETVTSLIEAHGADPDAIVRAAYDGRPGLPVLIPAAHQSRAAAEAGLHGLELVDALAAEGVPVRLVELGDPGIVLDVDTPRADLPPYHGPPEPPSGPPPDWNADLGRRAQEPAAPLD